MVWFMGVIEVRNRRAFFHTSVYYVINPLLYILISFHSKTLTKSFPSTELCELSLYPLEGRLLTQGDFCKLTSPMIRPPTFIVMCLGLAILNESSVLHIESWLTRNNGTQEMAPAWNMTTKTYLGAIYILWMLNKTRPSQLEKTEGNLIYFQRKKIKHQRASGHRCARWYFVLYEIIL